MIRRESIGLGLGSGGGKVVVVVHVALVVADTTTCTMKLLNHNCYNSCFGNDLYRSLFVELS